MVSEVQYPSDGLNIVTNIAFFQAKILFSGMTRIYIHIVGLNQQTRGSYQRAQNTSTNYGFKVEKKSIKVIMASGGPSPTEDVVHKLDHWAV